MSAAAIGEASRSLPDMLRTRSYAAGAFAATGL